jgi:5-methyltetrahydropteroyltriglutamate--homocysteine methyltransferase
MKTSTTRFLTTHVGSLPRPESLRALLRARLSGQPIDEAQLAAHVAEAVAAVVRQQAEVGLDVISDGEMGKTSFLAYAEERLTGFVALPAEDLDVPSSNVGGSWARRIDTRREWRVFREYYQEYLPRARPPAAPPTVCRGPISYKGQALLQRDLENFKAALSGIPEARVRYHLCWGSWQGPHLHDLGLRDLVDLLLRVKAQAYSVEAATPPPCL